MTENEAIEELQTAIELAKMCTQNLERKREIQGYEMAIKALKEVQQYRAIGTPEECKKSVSVCRSMIERNITPENMEEYMKFEDECVKCGFTLKSLLEAREKQIPYKPSRKKLVWGVGKCKCGVEFLDRQTGFCGNCGQKLDWSDEE